jgi:hypothetical protein
MQATGQALTQSATPSQVLVTIEWGMGVFIFMQQSILAKLGFNYSHELGNPRILISRVTAPPKSIVTKVQVSDVNR